MLYLDDTDRDLDLEEDVLDLERLQGDLDLCTLVTYLGGSSCCWPSCDVPGLGSFGEFAALAGDLDLLRCDDLDLRSTGDLDQVRCRVLDLLRCGDLDHLRCRDLDLLCTGDLDLRRCRDLDLLRCGDLDLPRTGDLDHLCGGDSDLDKLLDILLWYGDRLGDWSWRLREGVSSLSPGS